MDSNALIIDAITTLLTAFLTVTAVALLPYLQARRKEKTEQAAMAADIEAKRGVIGVDALEKMTGAFGDIQNFYANALSVANAKVTELREEVAQLEKLGPKIAQMEEMAEKIVELNDKIIVLKQDVRLARVREKKLKKLIVILSNQIRRLEDEPEVTLDDVYEDENEKTEGDTDK